MEPPTNSNPPADTGVPPPASGSTILWEDVSPERIHGYIEDPRTTLFFIIRHPTKPYRGTMSGAVIPDEDDGKGINENALIDWLKGIAAPGYLREFEDRLLARRAGSSNK